MKLHSILYISTCLLSAVDWMFVSSKNVCIEMPRWWYLEMGPGRWLCHKGRALINRISVFIGDLTESLVFSVMWEHNKNEPGRDPSQDYLSCALLGLPSLQTWEKFLLLISHPLYDNLLWKPKQTKIVLILRLR